MLNCKQASHLVSQAIDQKLPLGRRLSLRFHLMMCSACRAYRRQLQFMNAVANRILRSEPKQAEDAMLSPEARERLIELVRDKPAR